MKKINLFFLALLLSIQCFAQQFQVAGTCTMTIGTNIYGPMYSTATSAATSRTAVIYPATQLTGVVGQALTGISFKKMTNGNMTGTPNYKIYLKETASLDFGAGAVDWATTVAGATLVYDSNPVTASAGAAGWKQFQFSTNFTYSGAQNLMVLMEYTNTGNTVNTTWEYEYTAPCVVTSNNNTTKYINNTTGTPGASLSSSNYRRPFITLSHQPATQCTGAVTAGTASASTTNACIGVPFNLSLTGNTLAGGITYQWFRSPAGAGTFTAIAGATNANYTVNSQTAATDYRCVITCTNSGQTDTSNIVSVGQNIPSQCYCIPVPGGTSTTYYINSLVTTGGITNVNYTANSYNAYTNNSATSILALPGSTVTANIGTSSSTHYFKVWVDWNNNGNFTDAGEEVFASTTTYLSAVTAPILIPAAQAPGNYRIRFGHTFSGTISSCSTSSSGSFVDYTLTVYQPLPCSSAPPSGFSVSNVTATTAQINWLPAIGATYTIEYKKPSDLIWSTSTTTATNPSHIITGLTESTQYEVRIRTTCNGVDGTYSTPLPFTTTPLVYCAAGSTNTTVRSYISNVTVTPTNGTVMSSNSGGSNYTDYYGDNTKLITLIAGTTGNLISVNKAWTGTSYSSAVGVWIDFNRDGTFDASEKVLTAPSNTTTPVVSTPSFTVPNGAYIGPLNTRMRVVMRESTTPTACGTFAYGEVEDYPVKIKPCETTAPTNVTVTAVTDVSATVSWTPSTNNLSYIVEHKALNAINWTSSPLLTTPTYNITGLIPATTYEVRVVAVCGTTFGAYTTPVQFTTECDPAAPFVSVNQITPYTAVVNWTPTANASYVIRYRKLGDIQWLPNNPPTQPGYDSVPAGTTSYAITGLTPYTKYEVQVASICTGSTTVNTWSTSSVFTTERLCEMPPPGLTIINITPTTAEVTWDPYAGASYILRYRKVGIPSWTEITTNTNTYILTGLLEATKYEMQVANICNGTPGTFSDPYYFTTPTVVYCAMSSASASNEHISKVTVKPTGKPEMISTSVASTYTDYTAVPTKFIELIQGSTGNQITVDKAWLGASSNVGVSVWIDFNRNGVFEPNETILSQGPDAKTPVSATFNVPNDAFISMTDYKYVVMRVALQKGGIPVNCVSFADGEVEDYTVRISKPGETNPSTLTGIAIYPNPVKHQLFFKVEGEFENGKYKLYNSAGQMVASDVILDRKIGLRGDRELVRDVILNKLTSGVYYIDVEINTKIDGKTTTITAQKKFIKE